MLAKDPGVGLGGGPGSGDDPTTAGGSLRVFAAGGDGFDDTYALAASGWRALSKKKPENGYKFAKGDPVKTIAVKTGKSIKIVAKGSALTIHDFEDPGPDSDYLGVFFGDGRSGKWFDSHDATAMPVVTMAAEATSGGPPGNTRAIHYKGAAPGGWGATLGLNIANCYDASV